MIKYRQAKGQANKKPNLAMQKRKQARDVAGYSIRTYKKPDSYQLPDFWDTIKEIVTHV